MERGPPPQRGDPGAVTDASAMITECFRRQHPEAYGRPEILPEFPREASVTAEIVPEGFNREGIVWPEVLPSPEEGSGAP